MHLPDTAPDDRDHPTAIAAVTILILCGAVAGWVGIRNWLRDERGPLLLALLILAVIFSIGLVRGVS